MSFLQKADNCIMVGCMIGPTTCIIILIIIIGLIKGCAGNDIDPMDNSINAAREIVTQVHVLDTTRNGFRVVYVTANNVTKERLEEIQSRKPVYDAFMRLQQDALIHWNGNLMDADICEFAIFTLKYNVDKDIEIYNIFVDGIEKRELYVQNNPNMPGCARRMDDFIQQGNQYLNSTDINLRIPNGEKIYRYWKCPLYNFSHTDERFSHFLDKDRIE